MDKKTKLGFSSAKRYFPIAITAFFVLLLAILSFFAIYKIQEIKDFFNEVSLILQPIIFGIVISYLLNPAVSKFEKLLLKIKTAKGVPLLKKSYARGISVGFSLILALALLYILAYLIIPELISSVSSLIVDLPAKIDGLLIWTGKILDGNSKFIVILNESISKIIDVMQGWFEDNFLATIQTSISFFLLKTMDVFNVILNVVVGVIVSIYLLVSKEKFSAQSKKLFYAILKPKKANTLLDILRRSDKIFGGFITGKILDSLIIGIICFIVMSIFKMPYSLLISVIVGVTNLIPFFGPFIGAIPSAFLLLLVNPLTCLYFVIFIIILQQVDGNIIGPKILGNTTGLSPFWVIFSILLFGGLFGFIGMLLGVPVFAVIYYLVDRYINFILEKNSLPTKTSDYLHLESMTDDGDIVCVKRE